MSSSAAALWAPPAHLWEPQKRGIQGVIDAIARGNHVCLFGPTGSGKTECAVQLLKWAMDQGCGGSFYVNRKLLVHQTAERFTTAGLPFGIRAADYEDYYDYDAPVQICSADTERSRVYQRSTWKRHNSNLVIVDEAHIQKGETMRQILDDHRANGAATVLLTATPIGLSDWADELVISGTLQEYRDCNAIVPAVVKSIEQPDLRKVKRNATGEYVLDGRKRQIYTQSIVANVLDRWKKYNPDARPTMLYAPGKPESVWLTEQFTKMGVNWCHVDATDAVVDGIRTKLSRSLWEEILARYKAGDIKGISSRFKCLDEDTEILTVRGWVGCDEFLDDDRVATLNPTTFEVQWEGVKGVVRRRLSAGEEMYSIAAAHLDIRVTGNHEMLFKSNCKRTKGWKKWEADKLAKKRGAYLIPVAGLARPNGLGLTVHQMHFLGWFLSDGHRRRSDVSICQSSVQPDYLHDSIQTALSGSGLTWKMRIYNGAKVPFMRYSVLKSKNPGYLGLEKYLDKEMPLEVYGDISRQELGWLLETLNYGDGCKRKNPSWHVRTWEIFTGNQKFADNLQALCVTRGYRCNICPRKGGFTLYICNNKLGSIVKGCNEPQKCKIRLAPTRGHEQVWCVETETGNIFTRRNGKVAVVGNCREGVDLPSSYCCILATPIGSLASYIQTVGRVLRYSAETPDQVVVIDHGGNYWRHGSPNHDRPWDVWWTLPEHYISEWHLEQVREKKKPEPIRCPACEGERTGGIKCPHCGHTHEKSKRQVIMEDGRMKEVDGHLVKPKYRKLEPDTAQKWAKMFWGYRKKKLDKSFKQMEAFFAHEYGYFPPRDIPYMPIEHEYWCRPVWKVEFANLTSDRDLKTDKVSA